ncbi:helix-turn-helix domain-containing protein [Serratia fonticola]|jgi:fimbrial protein FimW|uniref:helix-turn-helix domain-containing protein n=1 Tax=Serratia fonticola TaxID=47917 RepID=UPI00217ADAC6|nr:LuxR C-terminal-related transcriptional regulator [Serratia fonticola]CAI1516790.1 two component system sensor kinase SsrB [Serratia fonticola]CAI1610032.1 two component system sensor kinase SsrB [Serratia fonticola]CAI1839722.1 two component system sensor kinase SsrB [Serratia fonticola]CAI2003985.1 two component system sensor kinase SsrB [Serratia fonticola]
MAASAKIIKVLIIDKDNYFIAGLRRVISDFYRSKDITVQFIDRHVPGFSADIIFQAFDYGAMFNVWRYLPSGVPTPLVFLIRDQRNSLLSHLFQSVRKSGTLYRNQPIDVVKSMLEEAISMQGRLPLKTTLDTQGFTLRESEVLRYLRQGKSHEETANVMRLNVKTVSGYKRSAMRKLNFKRNQELFHWLLQGGLSSSERKM